MQVKTLLFNVKILKNDEDNIVRWHLFEKQFSKTLLAGEVFLNAYLSDFACPEEEVHGSAKKSRQQYYSNTLELIPTLLFKREGLIKMLCHFIKYSVRKFHFESYC